MSEATSTAAAGPRDSKVMPSVRSIGIEDLWDVLGAGLRDFGRAPMFGLFFGAFYAVGGWGILTLLWLLEMPYLAYPLAMGFALIAPFVVTGLYDVSRRLELGQPLLWSAVLGSVWDTRRRDLRWMALVTAFALVIWLDIAAILFFGFLGLRQLNADLLKDILTTPAGLAFLTIGNTTGALIAFAIFSISVVSFPMLFDRDVDFATAMMTSVKTVQANPWTMTVWCGLIAVLVGLSIVTIFFGLLVVLPVLGHASWHLYRRVVAPAAGNEMV